MRKNKPIEKEPLKVDEKVGYQGKTAYVVSPNFAGKGTVEIKLHGEKGTIIAEHWELTAPPKDLPKEASKAPASKTAPDGESTIPANVSGTPSEGKEALQK